MTGTSEIPQALAVEAWRDPAVSIDDRVADLLARMSLEEKVGQLGSAWVGVPRTGDDVAPFQHELIDDGLNWPALIKSGLGQLTRPLGTAPVPAAAGARALAGLQADIVGANRFGIPAVAHEECLTGLMTLGATVFPTPLAWGASFDPDLVRQMAAAIGDSMRQVGVHQGLAPVLDVTRDLRWGRTEETMGEDPFLVATVGTAYVRGLQSAGVIATLKHFVGYSGSRAGRNFGPVGVGPRELADVFLVPFEMAVRDGGARSIMHSYAEIDGVPAGAHTALLTRLLREVWGFTGTVVADYFAITFLETLHHVAENSGAAAGLALTAGVDVELPGVRCYGDALVAAVRAGEVAESLVDRAATRVLRQKCELGLLDPEWTPEPPGGDDIDLDPPVSRTLARRMAEESIVVCANDGVLPLAGDVRVALVGPQADTADAMLGCYTFPSHVGRRSPDQSGAVPIPTLLEALRGEWPSLVYASGCGVDTPDTSGIEAAVAAAREADVCLVALGDRAGLFGLGTSGEGCDVPDLRLPGVQGELIEAVLATGTPTVLVLLSGRPYALGAVAERCAAVVQAFFPGEEGGPALANVLTGRVNPSGRLPVGVPRAPGGQPAPYLAPPLGHVTDVSTVDPTPLYPFGHGLSYTRFEWGEATPDLTTVDTDGVLGVGVTVRNAGTLAGAEVVQLYLHDPVAQVTRPTRRLIGYAKLWLEPGQARRVTFHVPADLASFVGRDGRRVVEPGELRFLLGASSMDIRHTVHAELIGQERIVDHSRRLVPRVTLT